MMCVGSCATLIQLTLLCSFNGPIYRQSLGEG